MNNPVTKYVATALRTVAATAVALALLAPHVQAQVPSTAKGVEHSKRVQEFMEKWKTSPFNLNSTAPNVLLAVNQFQCAVRSNGDTCADLNNSPINPGGFWPVGTPNAYMFNSGINMAAIIPRGLNFPWSGDTVAAFFFDARGTQQHGSPLTEIYNSLDPADLANWPEAGFLPDFPFVSGIITDTDIFSPVLVGRKNASQQDSWFAIWDGESLDATRNHPMGILVEQRTMAWNYPTGNEATIYFVYKVTNITNSQRFQQISEAQYFGGQNRLPDGGWPLDSIYLAYDSDPDVTALAGDNFGTAILPLNLMTAYSGDFVATEFDYRPDIFFPPFFTNAPGMVGVKYLRSPVNPATGREVGLTMFTAHTNGGAFPDPNGPQKLFRYWKGDLRPALGDPPCTFSDPLVRGYCYLPPSRSDVRLAAASGPFSLQPGQSVTIVSAMYAAATVNTPLINRGVDNPPGTPSRHPGCGGDPIRPIEVAAGWLGATCPADPSAPVDQSTVRSVPGSLVGKGLAAQAVFDGKFLLPSAPIAPEFNLIPGDGQTTVIWKASATETEGDPFFAAAADPDPTNQLRDPNFRRFDVEGYRIYKGTSPSELRLIAQFDKAGTSLIDFTCATDPTFVTGDTCPAGAHDVPLTGAVVQFPVGGVVRLANGTTLVVRADTAGAAGIASGQARALEDTGVPFAFIDTDVRNGFRYFYKVTAFDVNSLKSGPTSLESSSEIKSTTPQKSAAALTVPTLKFTMLGGDNQPLNPDAPLPTIDAQSGIFSGKMPPTNSVAAAFLPLVERLMPRFKLEATIDSVKNGSADMNPDPCAGGHNSFGSCWGVFMTFNRDGVISKSVQWGWTPFWGNFDGVTTVEFPMGQGGVPADSAALASFGSRPGFVEFSATLNGTFLEHIQYSSTEGNRNRRIAGCSGTGNANCLQFVHGGSRWFAGTNETAADPARFGRTGTLPGIDTVYMPLNHSPLGPGVTQSSASVASQCFLYGAGHMGRAADVVFTWGASGFSSVKDVTHNVDVKFSRDPDASYGFMTTDANGNGFLDWDDFNYINVVAHNATHQTFCGPSFGGGSSDTPHTNAVFLSQTPRLMPVSTRNVAFSQLGAAPTGNGFGLYVNGERYIFQTNSLPTSGTAWTLRTYSGVVRATTNSNTLDPGGYTFTGNLRPPLIPGLKFVFETDSAATLVAGSEDITKVHTVPDPYYGASLFDLSPTTQKQLQFVNVPNGATIRIYSLSGILVDVLNHSNTFGGGQLNWDLRNRSGQFVGSGVYLFHVSLPDGRKHIGKFTVINSGS